MLHFFRLSPQRDFGRQSVIRIDMKPYVSDSACLTSTKSSSTPQMQTRRCRIRLALYQWELAPSEVNIGSLHRSAVNETSTHRNTESVVRTKFGQHTVLAIVPEEEEQFPSPIGFNVQCIQCCIALPLSIEFMCLSIK